MIGPYTYYPTAVEDGMTAAKAQREWEDIHGKPGDPSPEPSAEARANMEAFDAKHAADCRRVHEHFMATGRLPFD